MDKRNSGGALSALVSMFANIMPTTATRSAWRGRYGYDQPVYDARSPQEHQRRKQAAADKRGRRMARNVRLLTFSPNYPHGSKRA